MARKRIDAPKTRGRMESTRPRKTMEQPRNRSFESRQVSASPARRMETPQPRRNVSEVNHPVQSKIERTVKFEINPQHLGGSYKEVRKNVEQYGLKNKEVHHMPADSASKLERNDGPAIAMEKADHRLTASCGSSREAQEYRAEQAEKISNGDFRGAFNADVADLRSKFGSKYDEQIESASKYVDELERNGKI